MAKRAIYLILVTLLLVSPSFMLAQSPVDLARMEIERGNDAEARRILEKAVRDQPRDREANFLLGYLWLKAAEYERAIASLLAASEKRREPRVLTLLAKAFILSGNMVKAEEVLLELTRKAPADAEGWSLLGQVYQRLNRFEEAIQPLEKGVKLSRSPDVIGLTALAFTHFALGNPAKAEETYQRALSGNARLSRPLADPHASFAVFLLRMNQVARAEEQVAKAEAINSRHPVLVEAKRALEVRKRSSHQMGDKSAAIGPVPVFSDVIASSGISFRLENHPTEFKHQIETMPGGIAVLDYNNDGLMDLYFTNGAQSPSLEKSDENYWNRLYRNEGNWRFSDVTAQAGVQGQGYMMGAAAGDYDNDGFTDLFVVGVDRNILYRNKGDGTFVDVTSSSGLSGLHPLYGRMWGIHGTWVDFDNDGWLDLLVVNYCQWDPKTEPFCGDRRPGHRAYCYPGKYGPLPNQLFRNNRDGTFEDVSVSSGIDQHLGKGMGAAIADFDSDGLVDIFVANDTEPNFLFRNLGKGQFAEEALERGVALNQFGTPMSAMGVDFRDFDNDGRPDLFVTALANEGFLLFRNNIRFFEDIRDAAGLTIPTLPYGGWSNAIADLNNDGWKDLFSANSHALDNIELFQNRTYHQRNQVFLNQGNGTYREVTAEIPGLQREAAHRGSAVADLDNDGRLDLIVTALGDRPALYRNDTPGGYWLLVRLIGREANREGLGAIVSVETEDGRTLWNHATTSVGFASSSDPRVHFGLGASRVKSVTVVWPGGKRQKVQNVEVDTILTVTQDTGEAAR